jgi:hypothetical protein
VFDSPSVLLPCLSTPASPITYVSMIRHPGLNENLDYFYI